MPITQERFYGVIRAARAFYTALAHVRETVTSESLAVYHGQRSAQVALDNITATAERVSIDPEHAITLGTEEKHYQLTSRKNAWQAEKQKQRRRGEGIPARTKVPKLKRLEEWDLSGMDDTSASIPPASSVIEAAPDQGPPSGDVTEGIIFGPEPTPIELSQQILRDNEALKEMEHELEALHQPKEDTIPKSDAKG